jgi:hypothetical protein
MTTKRSSFLLFLALAAVAAFSFWAGYAYSEFRVQKTITQMVRSSALTAPEVMLRYADLVEKVGPEEANKRMRVTARAIFETRAPNLDDLPLWCCLRMPSLGPTPGLAEMRAMNEERTEALRAKLKAVPN